MCMCIFEIDPPPVNRVPAHIKHSSYDLEPRYVPLLRPRQTNRCTQGHQHCYDQCVSHVQYLPCGSLLIQITQSGTRSLPVNMEGSLPWCGPSLLKQPTPRPDHLEVESKFSGHTSWCNEVGSTEGGVEIVGGDFVCHV